MARRSDHKPQELRALILDATHRIIDLNGVQALSARKIAAEIGYTVGTIYQYFQNMDDLVEQANMKTLRGMYDACSSVSADLPTRDRLIALAEGFAGFARSQRARWEAVITYNYAPGHSFTKAYDAEIERLLGLLIAATADLYSASEASKQQGEIRVLWTSLYGIFSLDAAGRLGGGLTMEQMISLLVDLYLDARGGK